MTNITNDRDQLERLHDRHKRLSLDVYDSINNYEDKDLVQERKKQLRETANELEALMKRVHTQAL